MLNAKSLLQIVTAALTIDHVDRVGDEGHQEDGQCSWVAIEHEECEYKLTLEVVPKPVYELPLDLDEIAAIGFWHGRYDWATACNDALDPDEVRLAFMTEGDAWEWKGHCENDAEGGHEMFSGVVPSLQEKLQKLYDSII